MSAALKTPIESLLREVDDETPPAPTTDVTPAGDEARRQLAADWAALPSLPAVRSGRIHVLTDDFLLLPGPRVAHTARRFAQVLHPEAEAADGR